MTSHTQVCRSRQFQIFRRQREGSGNKITSVKSIHEEVDNLTESVIILARRIQAFMILPLTNENSFVLV